MLPQAPSASVTSTAVDLPADRAPSEPDSPVRHMVGLVIDGHGIARRGVLSLAIETFDDTATWHGAATGEEGLRLARLHQPDMVLMDVGPPDVASGTALLAQLRVVVPAAHIVVTAGGRLVDEVKLCLESGADGALFKGSPEEEIALVLQQIDGGDRIIDGRVAARLHDREQERRRAPVALTDRERTVLELLAEGCSNREIGERLVLSPATVKDHVRHLLQKFDASSRLQALVKAAEAGMLQVGGGHGR